MNKVILIGRLTKTPELRMTQSGIASANFSLAVQRPFTNQEGVREADFVNCVVWRKQAENLTKYCTKGSQIAIEGRIQTRNYDAEDGTKRYVTEVVADNITFLGSKNSNADASSVASTSVETSQPAPSEANSTDIDDDPFKDFGEEVVLSDDDLPF